MTGTLNFIFVPFLVLAVVYGQDEANFKEIKALPMPEFLEQSSPSARDDWMNIASNIDVQKAEIREQLDQWLSKQPKEVQDLYKRQMRLSSEIDSARKQFVSSLSPKARELAAKIDQLRFNMNISPDEEMTQASLALSAAPTSVQEELLSVDRKILPMLY